jgi:hypothetical protein
MADGYKIDLRKLGEKLPEGVQRAGRKLGKAVEKPLAVASAISFPEDLFQDQAERLAHPITWGRIKDCTLETRAHLDGLADLPALVSADSTGTTHVQPVTLFRLRVERPEGDAETCVRQFLPTAFLKLVPGSSVRALAHQSDPRYVMLDWRRTLEAMRADGGSGAVLSLEQFAWPDRAEWPARGAIEIRDRPKRMRRLDERRRTWRHARGRLLGASSRGSNDDGRASWTLELDVEGRRVEHRERVPRLLIGRVVGFRTESHLGGIVESYEVVVDDKVPIPLLVSPSGELVVDWQALIDQPGLTAVG